MNICIFGEDKMSFFFHKDRTQSTCWNTLRTSALNSDVSTVNLHHSSGLPRLTSKMKVSKILEIPSFDLLLHNCEVDAVKLSKPECPHLITSISRSYIKLCEVISENSGNIPYFRATARNTKVM